MGKITLRQAAEWCGGTVEEKYANVVFDGATNDTRNIKPGQLFVALQGARDGHEFIADAMAGGAAAVKEVLAGRVPFLIDVMPNLLPHLKAGTLRALAVTTPSRSALLPKVPTMAEAGLPGVTLYAWDGIAAPKGLSDADADRFAKAARAALNDKAVRDRLLRMGAEPQFRGPADFRQFIEAEAAKWRPLALMARAQR